MAIETDASTLGWGATCNGARTGGPWSRLEQTLHINCLELLAATLAVKCFAKGKTALSIMLKMDSAAALTYINKRGGTSSPELTKLAKELWLWCMERNISLSAEHLPGVQNTIVDEESKVMKDRTDLMLCPQVFHQINQRVGPLEVDLFTTRLTAQLPIYYTAGDQTLRQQQQCLHPGLIADQGVRQPSMESDRQSPLTNSTPTSRNLS